MKRFISDYKTQPRYYIGGDLPIQRRQKLIEKYLTPLTPIEMGKEFQCRCGNSAYVEFRKQFYCYRCGARIVFPDTKFPDRPTFREAWEKKIR